MVRAVEDALARSTASGRKHSPRYTPAGGGSSSSSRNASGARWSASRRNCARSPPRRRHPARRRSDADSSPSRRSVDVTSSPAGTRAAGGWGMRQRLYEYLVERPAGATGEELLDLIFAARGRDPEFGRRFLTTLVGDDARFRFDPVGGRWRVRVHDTLARPLAEVEFVVVDLETTGGSPGAGGITEIGAVRVAGGRLIDKFATFVNPGQPIPPFVARLTGITDEMVADAPPIAEALPRFLEFAGSSVLVAHNAAFDM